MKFLIKIFLLINLMDTAICGSNNAPKIDTRKVWDCLKLDDICNIQFTVEPFMSMTYYKLKGERELAGYRAYFNASGTLTFFDGEVKVDAQTLDQPITTDGTFRPLITVNGQMPGPTIIARENQKLHITVYNELPNVEGISIHWHGMHQKGTPGMDGVAFITQYPILPYQSYTYKFRAFPAGTHWYHAHSGAHRTDGLYGALIVKDTIHLNGTEIEDLPENHTLLLMDWQRDPSIDLFYQIRSSLSFWDDETHERFIDTKGVDNTQIAPIPFWSGIINDKGRYYDKDGLPNNAELNTFYVTQGLKYRFRLIGAQALYAYKFSVEEHELTVIATDGNRIDSITDVHYVIVNTGERYDVVVDANQRPGKYWILAETLEVNGTSDEVFHNPIPSHKAEAFLQYEGADTTQSFVSSSTWTCKVDSKCRFVNCPYVPSQYADHECINVDQFDSPKDDQIEDSIYSPSKTLFYNFGFDGEKSTSGSSVDGINFRFPSHLPYTKEFTADKQACPGRGCDHDTKGIYHCACTQVIDINDVQEGQSVELVITNHPSNNYNGRPESSHPVHLHGHSFYVVKLGYPQYNVDGKYLSPNKDIECVISKNEGERECNRFITVDRTSAGHNTRIQTVRWTNNIPPHFSSSRSYVKKDTVIVPYGGYAVIRFTVDNPGWWFLHCHIEIHQLEGMSAVVKELQSGNIPDGQDLIENTDVTFVLDASGSVDETLYEHTKDFVSSIVEAMNIGQYNSRVAVLVFNHDDMTYFDLYRYTDKSKLIKAIHNLPYKNGNTNISVALDFLTTIAQIGSLGKNSSKNQAAIFITDGKLEGYDETTLTLAADMLKNTCNFELYAVGIGCANLTQLKLISSHSDAVYYQLPFTTDTLECFSQQLIKRLGGAPQSATTEGDAKNGLSGVTIAMIIIIIVLVIILIIVSICYQNSYRKWKSNYHKLDDDNKL